MPPSLIVTLPQYPQFLTTLTTLCSFPCYPLLPPSPSSFTIFPHYPLLPPSLPPPPSLNIWLKDELLLLRGYKTALQFTAMHCNALHYPNNVLQWNLLQCATLHCSTVNNLVVLFSWLSWKPYWVAPLVTNRPHAKSIPRHGKCWDLYGDPCSLGGGAITYLICDLFQS